MQSTTTSLITDSTRRQATIDFHDEEAQRQLTQAILHRDFGLSISLPKHRLCPPVPNRLNYVLWIQDIMHAHRHLQSSPSHIIRGIDVGTGASAIYPLLACKLEPTWEFVATEIDETSHTYAKSNINLAGLEERVLIAKASLEKPLLFPMNDWQLKDFDFIMCNPPFYSSEEEVKESAGLKELRPNAVCTGAPVEMIYTAGGEAGFVGTMVRESLAFKERCKWYTSMLGKLSSVVEILELIEKHKIPNYAVTEFVQGQTRRWAVAWSFSDSRLPDAVSRLPHLHQNHPLYRLQPQRNTLTKSLLPSISPQRMVDRLIEILHSIREIKIEEKHASSTFLIRSAEDTWSRKARRQLATSPPFRDQSPPSLVCSVGVRCSSEKSELSLEFQWIVGRDRKMFESFVSHIGRKVAAATQSQD